MTTVCHPGAGLLKNASPYWIAAASLAAWFLFAYAPTSLFKKGQFKQPVMVLHLIGAYPVYISCAINTLITPFSYHGKANSFHTWLGWIGLLLGLMGAFPYGVYYSFLHDPPCMTIISFVMASLYQLLPTYFGLVSIREYKVLKKQIQEANQAAGTLDVEYLNDLKDKRDQALSSHVFHMITCFMLGCAGPAGQRFFLTVWKVSSLPPVPLNVGKFICGYLSLVTQLAMIRPFHYTYFQQTKDVKEGSDPVLRLWNAAKKVCGDLLSGKETICLTTLCQEVYTQGLLFANLPGPSRAPTLVKKQKTLQ